jgi:alpha-beta hydrolase superfamily lysophospholipase
MNLPLLLLLAGRVLAADVTLRTADGLALHAAHEPVANASRAVLLVHGEGRTAGDWKFLAGKLKQAGMTTLALDLRGHGASTSAAPAPQTDEAWAAATADVEAALAFLRGKGAQQILVVGADVGASLVLTAAAPAADATNAVLLSAGLKTHGLRIDAALKAWGARPVLFVVSSDDVYAAKSALLLEAQATGPKHLEIYTGAGTGAAMLNREPACEGLVTSWLLGTYDLSADQARQAAPEVEHSGEAMQTDGPTMDEVLKKP